MTQAGTSPTDTTTVSPYQTTPQRVGISMPPPKAEPNPKCYLKYGFQPITDEDPPTVAPPKPPPPKP